MDVYIEQHGGLGKNGRLLIDGKEILFVERIVLTVDVAGLTTLEVVRTLDREEKLNVRLTDPNVVDKVSCPMCGSELERRLPSVEDVFGAQPTSD